MCLFYTDLSRGSGPTLLGGRGSSNSGHWNWTDKSEFSFSNWRSGFPDEGSEACVKVRTNKLNFIRSFIQFILGKYFFGFYILHLLIIISLMGIPSNFMTNFDYSIEKYYY